MNRKRWTPREKLAGLTPTQVAQRAEKLVGDLKLDPLVARLLVLRSHDSAPAAKQFLEGNLSHLPSPFLLKGMDRACQRLLTAIYGKEPILIMTDYDQDGQASAAIFFEFLKTVGAVVDFFVPHRERDGYGLSADAIRQAAGRGVKVVLSGDCGISNHQEALLCKDLEIDLIVTDHHQAPPELPQAYAIVNPHQPGCTFPDKHLCGAGVAFFLSIALRKLLRENGYFQAYPEPDLRQLLDLVALATVADLVSIGGGVNRILVKAGIERIEAGHRTGLAALRQVAEVKRVTAGTIGFALCPRLNASGRLGDARRGVELLLEQNIHRALAIAEDLNTMNRERQQIEADTVEQAVARIEAGLSGKRTIVLADESYHAGVIGICASRLVERYNRPALLIALDTEAGTGKGSCRSIRGFNMFDALTACAPLLTKFGGHEYAAGLSIRSENIEAFTRAMDDLALAILSEEDMVPQLPYDAEVSLGMLTTQLVDNIDHLAPFGMGNPGVTFITKGVTANNVRVLKGKHLKFTVYESSGRSVSCIAFGQAEWADGLEGSTVDLLFHPSINEWNGSRSVQCEVKDLRAH